MRGIVFLGDRQFELREFPDPTPESGEVVIEIKASGMCGTDIMLFNAPRANTANPVIAGHEPCGVIVAIGAGVPEIQAYPGMRVMVHHYKGCGVCRHCRTGWTQMCLQGNVPYGIRADGSHAQFMKVLARTLVPLPDELSFEVGAAISCGTGTAYGALRRIGLSGRETIAIFGQGPVGLSATQLAEAMGARVIAVDVNEERLTLARELGADVTINPKENDPVGAIKELTHGEGAELTMECTGKQDGRLAAVRSVRAMGKVGVVGLGGQLTIDVGPDLVLRAITLVGSLTFSTVWQMECARFIADRHIPVDKIITHRYQLDQAEEALKSLESQTMGKAVFVP